MMDIMILKANISEAFTSLANARQRTILAIIGIVIGIGSVIGMVSIGSIAENEALKQFKDMGVDVVMVRLEEGGPSANVTLRDITALKEKERSILDVAPYLRSSGTFSIGKKSIYLEEMGVTSSFFDMNKIRLAEGRFISDLDENRYFCVVGKDMAAFLRGIGLNPLLGSQFPLGNRIFTIVGVLDNVSDGGMRPYGINSSVIMPITTAGRFFEKSDIDSFLALVGNTVSPVPAKADIQNYFRTKSPELKVRVTTAEELIASMKKQMQIFSLLLGAIGSISLIVGGIGVMNVMLISVTERRMEIGLRRALGAQQGDIQSQFIMEALALCLVGGVIGIVLGVIVSFVFAKVSHWEFLISYGSIILGFGVAAAVGVFFGYYPARSAARLDPIKALRS